MMRKFLGCRFQGVFVALVLLIASQALVARVADQVLGAAAEEQAKRLIVMIEARIGQQLINGAGIVLGVQGDRLYIATANHVVRWGDNEAEDIKVELRILPGEPFAAKLLNSRSGSRALDLAVMVVRGVETDAIPVSLLPFDRLGNTPGMRRADAVYSVGNPRGNRWRVNVSPDRVSQLDGDLIKFESQVIAPGHSGGGLFDASGRLVGMIRADQPPVGEAVKIDRILEKARHWGLPVDLVEGSFEVQTESPSDIQANPPSDEVDADEPRIPPLAGTEHPQAESSPEEKRKHKITALLLAADRDLAALRLTRPANNNAFERYRRVLELEPDNPEARQGLIAITERYRGLVESALARDALATAQRHLDAARTVEPETDWLRPLQAKIDARKPVATQPEPSTRPTRAGESAAYREQCLAACKQTYQGCLVEIEPGSEAACRRRRAETCEQQHRACLSDTVKLFMGRVSLESECAGKHSRCIEAAAKGCARIPASTEQRCKARFESCSRDCRNTR